MGKAEAAYFEKINAEGGINGRKLKLINLDDDFNPAKTVEQTRKLIDKVGNDRDKLNKAAEKLKKK